MSLIFDMGKFHKNGKVLNIFDAVSKKLIIQKYRNLNSYKNRVSKNKSSAIV
jgi:hypothetical protein